MTTYIDGLGVIPVNNVEYTSSTVVSEFNTYMAALQSVLTNSSTSPNISAEYATIIQAMQGLNNLAQNGASGDPVLTGTYYMTSGMASTLGLVMNSLTTAGFSLSSNITPSSAQQSLSVSTWQGMAPLGVEKLVTNALGSTLDASRSLQSMIELEYVAEGNNLISANLTNLQAQLSTTQSIISNLTVIQNVLNDITVSNPNSFAFPPKNSSQIPSAAITALNAMMNSENPAPGIVALNPATATAPLAFTAANILASLSQGGALAQETVAAIQSGTPSNTAQVIYNAFITTYNLVQAGSPASAAGAVDSAIYNAVNAQGPGTAGNGTSETLAEALINAGSASAVTNSTISGNLIDILQNLTSAGQTPAVTSVSQAMISDYQTLANPPTNQVNATFITLASAYANDVANATNFEKQHPGMTFQSAMTFQTGASQLVAGYANNNTQNFVALYQIAASANFTQLFPTATPSLHTASSLLAAYTQLQSEITTLEAQTGQNAKTPNSLANFLQTVVQDISTSMSYVLQVQASGGIPTQLQLNSAVSAFIIDNQNKQLDSTKGFTAGHAQTDVTNAINAATSLNNTQQVSVNNYEFIFQQFYTSASNILSQIDQIIQGLAQAISKQ